MNLLTALRRSPHADARDDRDLTTTTTTTWPTTWTYRAAYHALHDGGLFHRRVVEDELVRRAVARLTTVVSSWRSHVDVDELDLTHPDRCVLGQLFAHHLDSTSGYSRGMTRLYGWPRGTDELPADALAFTGEVSTDAWRRHLAATS